MKQSIRIYNRFLDLKTEIDSYASLQYIRDFHGIGTFEFHINRYIHDAKDITKGDIIALGKYSNKAGIVLTKEISLDENGKESENYKLTGYTLDGLMSRRITVPPTNTDYDRKSGNAETVMKHYVSNHFINPADANRIMPHIEVAPNKNRGQSIEWESRFENVAEELESISVKTGLGWGVFADFKTKKLIFDVIEAKDLTQENPYGNNPVFFSPEFDTIQSQTFFDSDNDLRTVGYVGGQGEGVDRLVVEVGDNAGWDRIETFIDARDLGSSEEEPLTPEQEKQELIERGSEKMEEMQTIYTLDAQILTPVERITPFQYEIDYNLGDIVQVVNKSWGLTMTSPITQFKEIHESGGFRLEATFGRERPTLISKIQSKFNELEGIEKQELPEQIGARTMAYTDSQLKNVSTINLSLRNGWVNYGDVYQTAKARKDPAGYVHLEGAIKSGSGDIATLPVGFRPNEDIILIVAANDGVDTFGRINITAQGIIKYISGGNRFISLGSIPSFYVGW